MPGGVTGSGPRSRSPAWLQDLPLPLASALGVRLCQVGASFADLTTAHLARWRRRRRWLHRLCPRDSTSARYLSHHGIRHDGCIPDLAFQLFAHPRPLPAAGAAAAGGVCLSFRSDQTPGQAEAMAAAALALHRHLGHQRPWRAMVQVGRDRPGMERLRAVLEAAGCPIGPLSDHHGDIDACLAAYRQVSLVVSNRLHVLLMAASEGARILALIDGPGGAKLEGLLSDIGLQEAAMRSSQLALLEEGQPLGLTLEGRSMNATLQAAFDGLVPSSLPSSTSRWPRIGGSPGASQS